MQWARLPVAPSVERLFGPREDATPRRDRPNDAAMSVIDQARQLLSRGQWSAARPLLERAVRAAPKDADAAFLLARTLQMLHDREPAAYQARRCVDLRPGDPNVRIAAAEMLQALGKLADAEQVVREGLAKFPGIASMHSALINTLRAQGRVGDAGDAALAAASEFVRDPLLALIGAGALGESLRAREGASLVRRAVSLAPNDHRVLRAAATMLLYSDDTTDEELIAMHGALGRSFMQAHPAMPLSSSPHDPATPIRVGFVSPDLRDHAVARFLESWIGKHDRSRIAIVGIPSLGPADETTARLRAACDEWLDIGSLGDDSAVQAIRAARLDIAIDLAGWHVTARPRLFAQRLAPRQLNWLGYAHATGLPTIDARFVDTETDPGWARGSLEPFVAIEDCFLSFAADPRTPDIAVVDGDPRASTVRFVSFNSQQKINPTTLDLWCRVLQETSQTRLVLKARAMTDRGTRRILDAHLQSRGVDPARLEVLPHAGDYQSHLACYNSCDIALDTTPYAGTTTTCEAMLMGLPVVTLSGTRHASRVGASLLAAAGQRENVARDSDAFVALACSLAADIAARTARARAEAKQARRDAVMASPLCDGVGFARRFTDALQAITFD